MKIAMDSLCILFSKAFDIIEAELVGVSEYHSLRTAVLCSKMGKSEGYGDDALAAIFTCALFHDNALTEYTLEQRAKIHGGEIDLRPHCEYGQRNIEWLPFAKSVDGYILHHHSKEDGTGAFAELDFPHESALIGAADYADANFNLRTADFRNADELKAKISADMENLPSKRSAEALLNVLDGETLESLRDENIYETVRRLYPSWKADLQDKNVLRLARFISYIIDCKSKYTRKHSEQIANRAWYMGGIYGYSREERVQLYLAASLHDIGKIATPSAVLEKPGALDKDEYRIIMNHVQYTYDWLGEVDGLEKIRDWAANHHEKLDGTGYSRKLKAEETDFNSRLLACIDIYQAVCEERPYHAARSHGDTMPILRSMADKGYIDGKIVKDLDGAMAEFSLKDLPPPITN